MKHIKTFNEGYNYNDEFSYTANLTSADVDISYHSDDTIDLIKGTAKINWHMEFERNKNYLKNIDCIIDNVILNIIIDTYIDDNGNTTPSEQEIIISENITISIQKNVNGESFSLNPNQLNYDYDNKTCEIIFN